MRRVRLWTEEGGVDRGEDEHGPLAKAVHESFSSTNSISGDRWMPIPVDQCRVMRAMVSSDPLIDGAMSTLLSGVVRHGWSTETVTGVQFARPAGYDAHEAEVFDALIPDVMRSLLMYGVVVVGVWPGAKPESVTGLPFYTPVLIDPNECQFERRVIRGEPEYRVRLQQSNQRRASGSNNDAYLKRGVVFETRSPVLDSRNGVLRLTSAVASLVRPYNLMCTTDASLVVGMQRQARPPLVIERTEADADVYTSHADATDEAAGNDVDAISNRDAAAMQAAMRSQTIASRGESSNPNYPWEMLDRVTGQALPVAMTSVDAYQLPPVTVPPGWKTARATESRAPSHYEEVGRVWAHRVAFAIGVPVVNSGSTARTTTASQLQGGVFHRSVTRMQNRLSAVLSAVVPLMSEDLETVAAVTAHKELATKNTRKRSDDDDDDDDEGSDSQFVEIMTRGRIKVRFLRAIDMETTLVLHEAGALKSAAAVELLARATGIPREMLKPPVRVEQGQHAQVAQPKRRKTAPADDEASGGVD